MHCVDILNFSCVLNVVFVVFRGLSVLWLFSIGAPPWSYVFNNDPPAFFYAPTCPIFLSPHSIALIYTLPIHAWACTPCSRLLMRSCLCWCNFVFLYVCCMYGVRACVCVWVCWCVCACVLCLLMCLWLLYVPRYVFAHVFRICACVSACLYFGQNTCISVTYMS